MSLEKEITQVGCVAEYDPIKVVLVKRPGRFDYGVGMQAPEGYLFEGVGNIILAKKEHDLFTSILRKEGAIVVDVAEALLHGTLDKNLDPIEGLALQRVRELAFQSITYHLTELDVRDKAQVKAQLYQTLEVAHPFQLQDIIFSQPTHIIKYSLERNVRFDTTTTLNPLANLMFCRDQVITTDKGVVIGKMNSTQRGSETIILKTILETLGITPIYEVSGDARLEGGDFIPIGEDNTGNSFALLGQGLRTNNDCIENLIQQNGHRVFGYDYVCVVKDKIQKQDEMHLDTYFEVVAQQKAIVLEDRIKEGGPKLVHVDVYEKEHDGTYKQIEKDVPFGTFLRELKFSLLPLPLEYQRNYGLNVLTINSNKIIAVDMEDKITLQERLKEIQKRYSSIESIDGVSNAMRVPQTNFRKISGEYRAILENFGIEVMYSPFTHLNQAYGGPHCLTQVLKRGV